MAASTFSVAASFSMTGGPQFSGNVSVASGVDGNNYDTYAFNLPHGSSPLTVDAAALPSTARFGGIGFTVSVVNLNGATSPSVVLKLKAAGPAAADLSYTLSPGQFLVFTNNSFLTSAWTSITCTPDATADLFLNGILNVQNA